MVRIYRSTDPKFDPPQCSIFSHIFSGEFDPKNLALTDATTGQTFTRNHVRTLALQLGWSLRNDLSLKRGDTVALFSMNSALWPTVLLGAIAAGVRITTVNSMYTPSELLYQLQDSGAYYIFVHPHLLENAVEALKITKADEPEIKKRIILVGPSASFNGIKGHWRRLDDFLGKGQLKKEEPFNGEAAHETILLCYSSGTTSKSKGVELTHFNLVAVLMGTIHRSGYVNINKRVMAVLPFFHIYGLVAGVLLPILVSCPLVVMSQFTPEDFCVNIERYKVTVISVVPPMLIVLANHPAVEKYSLKSLEVLISAAAPLGKDLILAASARLEKQGAHVQITQAWGLTETSPAGTILEAEAWLTRAGSVGALISNIEARIVLEDGSDAAVGEEGEMWFRGPSLMKGYLNNPKATREAITPDGWFKTGDMAYVDEDGYFFIVDRMKELVKYKGFQVSPAELEGLLLTHPNVLDAGVIGVYSDAEVTELPRAYVVPREGAASLKTLADKEAFCKEVQTWIQGKVARYKYLRGGVVVIDAIPKSASGKILRKDLRQLAKESFFVGLKGKL